MADNITYKNVLLLDDDENGLIPYVTPATQSKLGTVKVGTGLSVTVDGTISYTLPTASASTLGGIKVGENLTIENGVLSAQAGGSSRNLGEIVTSSVPLVDAGLHPMDGSLIPAGGIYDDFVQYMADLYEENPSSPLFAQAETVKQYDYALYGPCSEINGILSNFKDSIGYATVPVANPTSSFEVCVKVRRSVLQDNRSMIHTTQAVYHGIIFRSHANGTVYCWMGNTGWNVANNYNTGLTISAGVWTWFKITWDGTTYKFWKSLDGETWTQSANAITSSVLIDFGTTPRMNLGGTNWEAYAWQITNTDASAEIDLNACYMKIDGTFAESSSIMSGGTLAWSGVTDVTKDAETIYDESVQRWGVCRKFVRKPALYAWITPNGAYGPTNPRLTLSATPAEGELMWEYSGSSVAQSEMEYVRYVDGVLKISGYYGTFPAVRYPAADYFGNNPSIRLPLSSTNERYLIDSQYTPTSWYRIYSDGWCEQGGHTDSAAGYKQITLSFPYLTANYTISRRAIYSTEASLNYRSIYEQGSRGFKFYQDYTFPEYWFTCGYIDISNYDLAPLYEYIVIATQQKTPITVNINQIATDLNNKVDKTDLQEVQCVIEEYHNGSSWYRLYSDGFCVQGGVMPITAFSYWFTVYLLKKYLTNEYLVTFGCTDISTWSLADTFASCKNKTARSFQIGGRAHSDGTISGERYMMWVAQGYVA